MPRTNGSGKQEPKCKHKVLIRDYGGKWCVACGKQIVWDER